MSSFLDRIASDISKHNTDGVGALSEGPILLEDMPLPASNPQSVSVEQLRGAENCVACGLCLPRCPTYRLTRDEAESPRGRIALMHALSRHDLPLSAAAHAHLEHCLGCRACEKVCPSYVPYGKLIDETHALLAAREPLTGLKRAWRRFLLDRLIASPARLRRAGKWLYGYQRSGLQRLLRASGVLTLLGIGKIEALLPKLSPAAPAMEFHPATGKRTGAVALFTGCVASVLDRRTQKAAIRLLNALGYDVQVPSTQGCCGALHLRTGETEKALDLMHGNLAAFMEVPGAIVTTASGCGAQLREYPVHLSDKAAGAFSSRVVDISQFLAEADWDNVRLRPLPLRIAVHDPCTLTNVLRQGQAPYALLKKIPEAEIAALPENDFCCGGAGVYPLTQPAMAGRLRVDKIRLLQETAPDILVTSNIGCALQLGAGIRDAGLPTEVLHPVVLIERQLLVASSE